MQHAGRADRAIILRGGSDNEMSSTLTREAVVDDSRRAGHPP